MNTSSNLDQYAEVHVAEGELCSEILVARYWQGNSKYVSGDDTNWCPAPSRSNQQQQSLTVGCPWCPSVHAVCCISSKLSSTKENLQIVSMQMTIPQKRISQNTHNILINECQKGTYFIVVNEEILKHYDFLNKLLLFCNILLPHKLKPTIIYQFCVK